MTFLLLHKTLFIIGDIDLNDFWFFNFGHQKLFGQSFTSLFVILCCLGYFAFGEFVVSAKWVCIGLVTVLLLVWV